MNRRIIFLDIDGTLTEPGTNQPPKSAVWAVQQARNEGHLVFLCTGRNYGMLRPLLQYGFDGVVASSGGYITYGEQIIHDCPMTEQQRSQVLKLLKEHGIYRTVECKESSYTDEAFKEYLQSHLTEKGNSELLRWQEQIETSLHILPMKEYRGQPVYKVVVMSPSIQQLEVPRAMLASEFRFCIQDGKQAGFINGEVVNRKFDKGKAVEQVCHVLNVPLQDSVAIGDSMNDREMLETAGLSICMSNGSECLKKLVDDICPSVLEHGIRTAFFKHHLINR